MPELPDVVFDVDEVEYFERIGDDQWGVGLKSGNTLTLNFLDTTQREVAISAFERRWLGNIDHSQITEEYEKLQTLISEDENK